MCTALIRSAVEHSELSPKDRDIHRRVAEARLGRIVEYAVRGNGQDSDTPQQYILDYFRTFAPHDGDAETDESGVLSRLKRVDVLYADRTKIAQRLRKGCMEGTDLVVGRAKKERPAPGEDPGTEKTEKPAPRVSYRVEGGTPNYFDLMVADAVYTLMKHRVPTIYARTVMGLLSGDEDLMLRPERKAEVENSIRKMIPILVHFQALGLIKRFDADPGAGSVTLYRFIPREKKKTGFDINT